MISFGHKDQLHPHSLSCYARMPISAICKYLFAIRAAVFSQAPIKTCYPFASRNSFTKPAMCFRKKMKSST